MSVFLVIKLFSFFRFFSLDNLNINTYKNMLLILFWNSLSEKVQLKSVCSGDIENDHLAIVSQQTAVFSRRDDEEVFIRDLLLVGDSVPQSSVLLDWCPGRGANLQRGNITLSHAAQRKTPSLSERMTSKHPKFFSNKPSRGFLLPSISYIWRQQGSREE